MADARSDASSDLSETQVQAGLLTSVSPNGFIEIETKGPSYASAAALADALAARLIQLGRIASVRAGVGVLALGDFGTGAFSASPGRIVLLDDDPTHRPALDVVCAAAVGCGAGTTFTFPFRAGRTYRLTVSVRSRSASPANLIVAVGHDARDVTTSLRQVVRRPWRKVYLNWTPDADLGSVSVAVQTATPGAADFEIGEATIANTGQPRPPLFGSLDSASVQRLLLDTRAARIVPASPAGDTSVATNLWAAIALGFGLLTLLCVLILRRAGRDGQPSVAERPALRVGRVRVGTTSAVIAGLVLVGMPLGAAARYPGTALPFLLFQMSYTVLLLLAIPRPRRYAYTFLAIFLFLGFWAKFNLHTIFDYAFQEPIGRFDDSGQSWDNVLVVASAAAVGAAIARLAQLSWDRHRNRAQPGPASPTIRRSFQPPSWYLNHRTSVWVGTAAAGIILFVGNAIGAFYQIGVDPRLVLPFHLNVLVGWMVQLGVALWIALLVHWEDTADGALARALVAPTVEAPVATISALSRGIYLFHLVPYGFVLFDERRRLGSKFSMRALSVLAALAVTAFVLSLVCSSALRLAVYPQTAPASSASVLAPLAGRGNRSAPRARDHQAERQAGGVFNLATVEESRFGSTRVAFMVHEVFTLFTDRWTGLEGVMAVSASDRVGWSFFRKGVEENPNSGQRAAYQLISGANLLYANYRGFTFLTLPGIVAILDYSGSLPVVLLGMLLITAALLAVERLTLRFTGNLYLAAVTGLAMANELAEANFPRLLGTFFVLLIGSLICVAALYAWRSRPKAGLAQDTPSSLR